MHKKGIPIFFALVFLCAIVSCSDWKDPFYATGDLTLYNNTSLSINSFYLTPVDDDSWGPNRLESPLPSGGNFTLKWILADNYDARAVIIGALSTYSAYRFDLRVHAWETTDLVAYNSDFSGSLKIINNAAGATITAIYIAPTGSGTWGPNQIIFPIAPGNAMHFYDLFADSYDVRIVWNSGPDSFYYDNIVSSLTLLTLYVD